eukprot:5805691-Pyramimonas_sp.AAC.1
MEGEGANGISEVPDAGDPSLRVQIYGVIQKVTTRGKASLGRCSEGLQRSSQTPIQHRSDNL